MGDVKYPGESQEYREARDALLSEEKELVEKIKSVAAKFVGDDTTIARLLHQRIGNLYLAIFAWLRAL